MTTRRGFTLIELMIAMSLVVILAAIATPRLHQSMEQARAAAAVEAVSEIRTAYAAIGEPGSPSLSSPAGEVPAPMKNLLTASAFRPGGRLLVTLQAMSTSDTLQVAIKLMPNGNAGSNTLLALHRLLREKHVYGGGRLILLPLSEASRRSRSFQ